ncbi:MFS transporter [soil metagenome]
MTRAAPAGAPSGRDVLRDRGVVVFLVAASLSAVGMFLQAAALGKQLYDITNSELALGMLGLVEFAPALFLLPLTGSAADRFDRRRVSSIGLAGEVVTSVLFLFYALSEPTSGIPIFGVALLFGISRAFVSPSIRSIPPLVAPAGGLPRLMGIYSATWQVGLIVGPASSGLLYDVHPAVPYAVGAACFGLSAVAVLLVPVRRSQDRTPVEQKPSLHHALEGLRFIRGRPVLLGAIALDLFAVLFGGAVALLPAIAEDRLHVGNVGYGWLRAAPGVGAVVVAMMLAARPLRRRIGRSLLAVVAVFGAGTMVLGFTTNYVVAFGALVVLAGTDAVSVFICQTIVPLATPDHMRGRVSAVENVFIGASNEVGAFESGVASALIGVGPAIVVGGALTIGVVGVWSIAFPDLRDIDSFDDVTVPDHSPTSASATLADHPLLDHEVPFARTPDGEDPPPP